MEFLFLLNSVLAGDKGAHTACFSRVQVAIDNELLYVELWTWFCHEIHNYHSGCNGWNVENIELS